MLMSQLKWRSRGNKRQKDSQWQQTHRTVTVSDKGAAGASCFLQVLGKLLRCEASDNKLESQVIITAIMGQTCPQKGSSVMREPSCGYREEGGWLGQRFPLPADARCRAAPGRTQVWRGRTLYIDGLLWPLGRFGVIWDVAWSLSNFPKFITSARIKEQIYISLGGEMPYVLKLTKNRWPPPHTRCSLQMWGKCPGQPGRGEGGRLPGFHTVCLPWPFI